MKLDWGSFIITMIFLYIGAIIGNFVTPMLPVSLGGWGEGLFVALIQVMILAVVGVISGKMNLWGLVTAVLAIFIGGLAGGYIASFLGISGMYSVIVILAIQTLILSFMKITKGNKLR